MAVPNGAKRRHSIQQQDKKHKRFKPRPPGPRFGPPALLREAFGPPFPRGPGPFPRFGPPPHFLRPFRPPFPPFRTPFPQRALHPPHPPRAPFPPPHYRPPRPPDRPWVPDARVENGRRAARAQGVPGPWRARPARVQVPVPDKKKYLNKHPEKISEPFQINPDAASKGVDFTEDLKF